MKFIAYHVELDVDASIPILEVVEADTLAAATKLLAYKMQTATIFRVGYDDVRGVIVVKGTEHGPHDGAVLRNWPG